MTERCSFPPRNISERNQTIDAAKGIGIFLVVFAHLNYLDPLQKIIYSFHMPLFFLISGMLFNANKYSSFGRFLRRRFQTLIAPYLLFSFASLAYNALVTCVSDGVAAAFGADFCKGFLWIFIAQSSQKIVNTPLWFVPCLFLTECVYFWVCQIKNKFFYLAAITVIVVFGWFTESCFCPIDL